MTQPDASPHGRLLVARADATTATGTGHLMRVLALAQAWVDAGGRVLCLVREAPDGLIDRLAVEGAEVRRILPAREIDDAEQVRRAMGEDSGSLAVLDGTAFDDAYLERLAGVEHRVLLIDDLARPGRYPVGYVLNQNAHAERDRYPDGSRTRFLLGLRYALLRREFRAPPAPRPVPARASRLLVTFGGSDPTGMTRRTLEAVRQLGAATGSRERLPQLRVIAGAANPDPAGIAAAAAAPELEGRVEIVRAAREMRPHLEWADLAVTSGGSTVWELARLGCPMLVVETVPAEELLVAGLAQVGLGDHLGHERDLGTQALADAIAARIDDAAWRAGMSERGRRLVDGQGAPRVAGVLAQAS